MPITYPEARRVDVVDTYFGTEVQDPYRWLEEDTEETKAWINSQVETTTKFLATSSIRDQIRERIKTVYNYEKLGCPRKRGDRYYFQHNSGLQNQFVFYYVTELGGEWKVFFDPNKLSEDGTVSLSLSSFTEDGKLWAYGLARSGSDWNEIRIKNTETLEDLEDVVNWVKFSDVSWTHDGKGFFYSRYDEPKTTNAGTETAALKYHKVYYHTLGTSQSQDVLVYKDDNQPDWLFNVSVSDDGKFALAVVNDGCIPQNLVYWTEIEPLQEQIRAGSVGASTFKAFISEWKFKYDYVFNVGTNFWFSTTDAAPRQRLIKVDLTAPEAENWTTIIAHSDEVSRKVLSDIVVTNGKYLLVSFMKDVVDYLHMYTLDGELVREFDIGVGAIQGLTASEKHDEVFIKVVSFLSPGRVFHFKNNELAIYYDTKVNDFDPDEFTQKQVFYESKDGTRVPMFIVHKKGLELNNENPGFLYGYGGFNISLPPNFSATRLILLKNFRCVWACPNIRGGGEYGEEWHSAGKILKKQNSYDDFQYAAKWLIDNGYTSAKKLTINGGSNGGLLVAACANQAPSLFGCVLCSVGVLDMTRFHKFSIGHAWRSDYGSVEENEEQFQSIIKYSPYHTIPDAEYPATMLLTADHDDRVVPLHSFKFAAALQHKLRNNNQPLIIRIEINAGHGAGKPTHKVIEESVDLYTFAALTLGLQWYD